MRETAVTILVLGVVILGGCMGPLSPGQSTDTSTPPTDTATQSAVTPTQSPAPSTGLPPGVTEDGIQNASRLLEAHVEALNRTGFIGVGSGNGTVVRNGILVDVESDQRNVVGVNASQYLRNRTVVAGPIRMEWEAWGNETVELRRTKEGDGWKYSREEPASAFTLAGQALLAPYLEGGAYTLNGSETVDNETRYRLETTEVADAKALREALPDATERITAFEATVVVDSAGRIHSVRATAEYVIRGQDATHELDYTLEQVGATVSRPDWTETARNETRDE